MNGTDPFWGNSGFAPGVFKRLKPLLRYFGLIEVKVDAMKRHVGHRVEVFFVSVPSSLKAGNRAVRAVQLPTLKSDHARLTPCER